MRHFDLSTFAMARFSFPLLALLSAGIIGWMPGGNGVKLAALALAWAIGFRRLSAREVMVFVGVNLLFAVMNSGALQKGIFRFSHPDVLSMPWWEFGMWGFYVLNTLRFLGGKVPAGHQRLAIGLAAVFSVPFSTVADPVLLFIVAGAILLLALFFFHEIMDLAYTSYFLGIGVVIEYAGVWSGQWSYPANPPGGVPMWFIPMWAGVGLFTRRLLLPLLAPAAKGA